MFKKDNQIWWYLVAAIVLFIVFGLYVRNFLYPYITFRYNPFQKVDYQYEEVPEYTISADRPYFATLNTNIGQLRVELYPQRAPQNVNNFVFLSRRGYYNGTKFHRLFRGLFIQGGDRNTLNNNPGDDGLGNAGYRVQDEVSWAALGLNNDRRQELRSQGYEPTPELDSLPLDRHYVAMANYGPDTNSSQFIIVFAGKNNERLKELNGKFTVIGKVVAGVDVLNAMSNAKVDASNPNIPRPRQPIVIRSVSIN